VIVDESFRDLVDGLDAIVWEADPERRCAAFVSRRTVELLGYPASRWLEEPDFWANVIHPDDRVRVLAEMRGVLDGSHRDTIEYRFVAADGRLVWVRNFWQCTYQPDGRRRIRGMAVDITEQRMAEEERKRMEQIQRLLSDVSAQLVASLDCESTLARVAQLVVPTVADACQIDIVESDTKLKRVAARYATQTDDETASDTVPASVLRGRISLHARKMVVPIVSRKQTLGVLTLASGSSGRAFADADFQLSRDLAHRCAHAIENAQLYRQAQQAVRVRDEFLAATSHELRTPLHHIKAFVSSLRLPDVDWDQDTRQDFLAEIEREADRLARLIADLLDLSRVESGGLDAKQHQHRSPAELVHGGLDRVRGLLNGWRLIVDVPADLPAVHVDVAQLEGVIANLVENATKYARPSGTTIWIRASEKGHDIEVIVEDDGPGIPPKHLETIFDKFFRLQKSEQSGTPGTGLGLAICRAVVRGHGGQIRAENRAEGGARFVITLPARILGSFSSRGKVSGS
jgi:PAS domain S-box-containing protein